MIETAALATYIVGSFLVPLLKKGTEKLTDELGEKVGATAADGLVGVAQRLWDRVRGKSRDTDDEPVVDLFERQPDRVESSMVDVVRSLLEADPDFRQEATRLLEERDGSSPPRWQLMGEYVAAVDARNARVSGHGQMAAMIFNSSSPRSTSEPPGTAPGSGS
jgi:hypothetical protein